MKIRLVSSKKLHNYSPVKRKFLLLFIKFCVEKLNISEDIIEINLLHKDDYDDNFMSLACFVYENNKIYCRFDNRILIDVFRSLSHEIVHLKQKLENKIDLKRYSDIGGEIEDEANFLSGRLVKEFINEYKLNKLYKID